MSDDEQRQRFPYEDSHEHRLHRLLFELQTYMSRASLEAAINAARLPAAVANTPRAAEARHLLDLLMTAPSDPRPLQGSRE